MQIQFLSDSSDLRTHGGGSFSRKPESSGLFWWTILITLMMGLATFCWFFSIMVFQHPEKPFAYKVLAKLDKLPIIRNFSTHTAPTGSARSAKDLLATYYAYTPEQLNLANDILKRSYIRNYDKQEPPTYVVGEFEVLSVVPLSEVDVMKNGWVVRGRSIDIEDVDVELLMPGLAMSEVPFQVGDKVSLDKRSTFAALLHVQRQSEDRLCCTVVSLVYGGVTTGNGVALKMEPPRVLNLEASWPITTLTATAGKGQIAVTSH